MMFPVDYRFLRMMVGRPFASARGGFFVIGRLFARDVRPWLISKHGFIRSFVGLPFSNIKLSTSSFSFKRLKINSFVI